MKLKKRIAIIAGEVSGDKIGSDLISELKSTYDIELCGVGGVELSKHGLRSLFSYEELSIIGLWDIVRNIFTLRKRIYSTVNAIIKYEPELLIIIDSPEFTHRVAKKIKKSMPTLTVINYVSPTIWFWRQHRAKKMREYVSHILSIYPFETDLYQRLNGPSCTYVGNPLFENIIHSKSTRDKISSKKKKILFMPGSRKSEIEKLLPICLNAFIEIKRLGYDFSLKIPTFDDFIELIDKSFLDSGIEYSVFTDENKKIDSFWQSDFAITASGSATLELAACYLPMIVIYKLNTVNSILAKIISKANNLKNISISLPNIISGTKVIPELLLSDCNSEKIAQEVIKLFCNQNAINEQLSIFKKVHEVMSVDKKPERAASDIISGYL